MTPSNRNDFPRTLIIGGSGLTGSHFIELSNKVKHNLITPAHKELDITDKKSVLAFISEHKPEFIVNFAAVMDIENTEKQRGDKTGLLWKINVDGVKHLVEAAKKRNLFLIQISSDAVFRGTDENPGPYSETDAPAGGGKGINWYGVSKLASEKETRKLKNFAILRISHVFGNPRHPRDLIVKTINDIKKGHGLFTDQFFTPSYTVDIAKTIWLIIKNKQTGIFHTACRALLPRYEFGRYVAQKYRIDKKLQRGNLLKMIRSEKLAPRTRLGGFLTEYTQKTLKVRFYHWREALDQVYKRFPNLA